MIWEYILCPHDKHMNSGKVCYIFSKTHQFCVKVMTHLYIRGLDFLIVVLTWAALVLRVCYTERSEMRF